MSNERFEQLDSLRGLAAISVVIWHAILILPTFPAALHLSPLYFLWAGDEAVILFFVLSGFVLSLPFYSKKTISYPSYFIKRVCRIYIPYIVAISTTFVGCFLFSGQLIGVSPWIGGKWVEPITVDIVVSHILLIGNYPTTYFNPVVWSLIHEMRISILFPFLMYLIVRLDWKVSLGIGISLSCMAGLNNAFTFEVSKGYHSSFIDTLHYVLMFILGALLAKHRAELSHMYTRLPKMHKIVILLVGFLAYNYSRLVPILGYKILPTVNSEQYKFIVDWGISVGAALFIVISLGSKTVSKLLLGKPLIFNGRVSYSTYLYHTTILFIFFSILTSKSPFWSIYIVSLFFIVIVALLSWRFIENPSVALGRRLSKLSPSTNFKKQSQRVSTNKSLRS